MKYANFNKFCYFLSGIALLFFTTNVIMINQVKGQESTKEPLISLKVQNQPLGDVLNKISQDIGYEFNLNGQWKYYPVNVSIQNMPLNRGLKRILANLNHAIIYESAKKIKIVVYGKPDSRKTDSFHIPLPPIQFQEYQQESVSSPEPPSENTDKLEPTDKSSEETGAVESKDLNQDSDIQGENSNEENEEEKVLEDDSTESAISPPTPPPHPKLPPPPNGFD